MLGWGRWTWPINMAKWYRVPAKSFRINMNFGMCLTARPLWSTVRPKPIQTISKVMFTQWETCLAKVEKIKLRISAQNVLLWFVSSFFRSIIRLDISQDWFFPELYDLSMIICIRFSICQWNFRVVTSGKRGAGDWIPPKTWRIQWENHQAKVAGFHNRLSWLEVCWNSGSPKPWVSILE